MELSGNNVEGACGHLFDNDGVAFTAYLRYLDDRSTHGGGGVPALSFYNFLFGLCSDVRCVGSARVADDKCGVARGVIMGGRLVSCVGETFSGVVFPSGVCESVVSGVDEGSGFDSNVAGDVSGQDCKKRLSEVAASSVAPATHAFPCENDVTNDHRATLREKRRRYRRNRAARREGRAAASSNWREKDNRFNGFVLKENRSFNEEVPDEVKELRRLRMENNVREQLIRERRQKIREKQLEFEYATLQYKMERSADFDARTELENRLAMERAKRALSVVTARSVKEEIEAKKKQAEMRQALLEANIKKTEVMASKSSSSSGKGFVSPSSSISQVEEKKLRDSVAVLTADNEYLKKCISDTNVEVLKNRIANLELELDRYEGGYYDDMGGPGMGETSDTHALSGNCQKKNVVAGKIVAAANIPEQDPYWRESSEGITAEARRIVALSKVRQELAKQGQVPAVPEKKWDDDLDKVDPNAPPVVNDVVLRYSGGNAAMWVPAFKAAERKWGPLENVKARK